MSKSVIVGIVIGVAIISVLLIGYFVTLITDLISDYNIMKNNHAPAHFFEAKAETIYNIYLTDPKMCDFSRTHIVRKMERTRSYAIIPSSFYQYLLYRFYYLGKLKKHKMDGDKDKFVEYVQKELEDNEQRYENRTTD